MHGKSQRKRWPWALPAILILAAGVALGLHLALRAPAGRAAANVAQYRMHALWSRWFDSGEGTTGEGVAISGVVRDESGQPPAEALVLVSMLKGVVYQA